MFLVIEDSTVEFLNRTTDSESPAFGGKAENRMDVSVASGGVDNRSCCCYVSFAMRRCDFFLGGSFHVTSRGLANPPSELVFPSHTYLTSPMAAKWRQTKLMPDPSRLIGSSPMAHGLFASNRFDAPMFTLPVRCCHRKTSDSSFCLSGFISKVSEFRDGIGGKTRLC
jgi:hypothetical protein